MLVALVAAGCSRGEPRLQELEDWERQQVFEGSGASDFDQVAMTSTTDTVAWFSRPPEGGGLAYRELFDGEVQDEIRVSMPDDEVLIPVDLAAQDDAWVAVAVTRDRPAGENSGLMAWQGTDPSATPAPARPLPQDGEVPEVVSAARAGNVDIVVGVVDGELAAWRSENGRLWRHSVPDLELDHDLAFVDVAALGDRLVLAGVDDTGGAHLWASSDGEEWEAAAPDDELPSDVRSVTLPAPLSDGELAVVWTASDQTDPDDPRSGSSATLQRFDGETLADEGTIEATDGIPRFAVTGATESPEGRLVAVGRAFPPEGTTVPMIWLREGGSWQATAQSDLTGRLDHQFRAVTTDGDDMIAVVTPWPAQTDVEVWRWNS